MKDKTGSVNPLSYQEVQDEQSDKMLIVAALSYLVLPIDLISAKRLPIIGWIDEAVSLVYAYKKVCRYVTPEIRCV